MSKRTIQLSIYRGVLGPIVYLGDIRVRGVRPDPGDQLVSVALDLETIKGAIAEYEQPPAQPSSVPGEPRSSGGVRSQDDSEVNNG